MHIYIQYYLRFILFLVSYSTITPTATDTKTATLLPNIPSKKAPSMDKYILPKDVKPVSYDLHLQPNLKTETFTGKINIVTELLKTKSEILMHNNGLTIHNVQIDGNKCEHETDKTYELLQIKLPNSEVIQNGLRRLSIEFSGNLKDRLVGFYSSKYTNETGKVT